VINPEDLSKIVDTAQTEHAVPRRLSAAAIRRQPDVCREFLNSLATSTASARRRAWVGVSAR
jgi:hypothetical protein